jgi:NitT/TauT family transport system substrate-binding protein
MGSRSKASLRVGIIDWPGFYPLAIAKEKGLLEKEGLTVELKVYPDNPSLDLAGGVFSDAIIMKTKGTPLQVVAVPDYSNTADVIIARPSIKTAADLKGKRISFEKINSFSHLFVSEFLHLHHIPEVEIQYVDLSATNVLQALENNEIDAGHTWDPTAKEALQKGYHILGYAGQTPGIITEVLFTHEDFLKKSPNQLKRLLRVFFEAQKILKNGNPAELTGIAPLFHQTPEGMIHFLKSVDIADLPRNIQAFQTSDSFTSLHFSGNLILDQLTQRGQISDPITVDDLLNPSFLPENR